MIKMEGITKLYKGTDYETVALNNVSFCIGKGDFVAIMGPSGSGKTTLLHLIGGINEPTEGKYILDGKDVSHYKGDKLTKLRKNYISFVFQNFALLPNYTVFENMEIPLLAKNISKKERKQRIMDILKNIGLENVVNKTPSQLSGGQQQRIGIARAVVSGNDILLADEPTGALDQKTGKEIMDMFEDINKEGKTVIVVTHDVKVAERANRVLYIEDGCLRELTKQERLLLQSQAVR